MRFFLILHKSKPSAFFPFEEIGPDLLKGKKGARFRLVQDKEKPHVSMVVWEFEDEKIQAEIEQLI